MSETALTIKVTGEVQSSNMAEFEANARIFLYSINTELVTDQDFGEAKKDVKSCKDKEVQISIALHDAMVSMDEISKIVTSGEKVSLEIREKRLMLEKLVKTEEDKRKKEITDNGITTVNLHLAHSPVENGFIFDRSLIIAAIKGKKSLSKMEEAVADVVEGIVADIDILSEVFNQNIMEINDAQKLYPGLFPDKNTQALNPVEQVALLISSRVNQFIIDQEKAKKEREAKKAEDDRIAKEKTEQDEKDRLAREAADLKAQTFMEPAEVKQEVQSPSVPERQEVQSPSNAEPVSFKSPPTFNTPPPFTEDKTYTITFMLTGSEHRRDELCERLRMAQGVSNVTGDWND